jgi:hypothetical protein
VKNLLLSDFFVLNRSDSGRLFSFLSPDVLTLLLLGNCAILRHIHRESSFLNLKLVREYSENKYSYHVLRFPKYNPEVGTKFVLAAFSLGLKFTFF